MQAPTPLADRGLSHVREGFSEGRTLADRPQGRQADGRQHRDGLFVGPPKTSEVEYLDHRGQKLFCHLDVARAEMATRTKAKCACWSLLPAPGALGYFGRTWP